MHQILLPMVVFVGGQGFDIEGMHPFLEFLGQRIVNQPMPFDTRKSGKSSADDFHFEMCFAARIMSGMAFMARGIVDDFHMNRLQGAAVSFCRIRS